MTEAERERVAIVAWLRSVAEAAHLEYANQPPGPAAASLASKWAHYRSAAGAIEAVAHLPTPAQSTEGER